MSYQGSYISSATAFTLPLTAGVSGDHTLIAEVGTRSLTCTFAAVLDEPFAIPNVFPEIGLYNFRILNPDGNEVDDGSGCDLNLSISLHCGEDSC